MITFYIEACDVQETEEDDRLIKGATRAGFTVQFSDTEANQERSCGVRRCSVQAYACLCALPQYLRNHSVFQLCGDIVVQFLTELKRKEHKNVQGQRACTHVCTHTHTELADTSSLCYFHLLLRAMILQKKKKKHHTEGRKDESRRSQLLV